jgi:hypothetical protein
MSTIPQEAHGGVVLELPTQWLAQITESVVWQIEEQERWVTVEGLAAWLGCDSSHIYDLRERGLPGHRLRNGRVSKRLYFSLREVGAWFEHESILR